MKKMGGKPVVEYLLGFVQDKNGLEKRRAAAMAALQGNLDRNSTAQAQVALAIAGDPATPDSLRDLSLQRVGEFPRAMVVEKLFELFKNDNWKVRWVAASLVLKMSDSSQIPEFMSKLGQAEGLAITEPLSYGGLLSDVKGTPRPGCAGCKILGYRQLGRRSPHGAELLLFIRHPGRPAQGGSLRKRQHRYPKVQSRRQGMRVEMHGGRRKWCR